MKRLLLVSFLALLWIRPSPALALPAQQDPSQAASVTIAGQTMMTVTVVLTDSTVIEIPIALEVAATTDVSATMVITAVAPQTGTLLFMVDVQSPFSATRSVGDDAQAAADPADGPPTVTANRNANLRTGPGTSYDVAGSVTTGDILVVVGKSAGGDWLLLDGGAWIAAFLVDGDVSGVVVVEPTATPTLRPTATPRPTATATPVPPTPSPTATFAPTGAWYSGGTLHRATWAEWLQASDANRLATAADWITSAYEPQWQTVGELLILSNGLLDCLFEMEEVVVEYSMEDQLVNEIAVLCILTMMGQ